MKQMLGGEPSSSGIDPATLGRTLKGISWRAYASGVTVFVVGAALAVSAYLMLRERTQVAQRAEFEQVATQLTSSFRTRLELPLEVLHSIESLFLSSAEVTRSEYGVFVSSALQRHPGIHSLEWIPVVKGAERERYTLMARADGVKDFEFKQVGADLKLVPADQRPEYLPIFYQEPSETIVLGFDLASDPARRAPVDRARERNAPVVTERMRLVQDAPTVASIAVFLPVHANKDDNSSVLGFAAAVFRVRQVVEPALNEALARKVHVVLTDSAAAPEARLLFESTPGLQSLAEAGHADYATPFPYVDRSWKLSFIRSPQDRRAQGAPLMVLGFGLVASALLGLACSALKVIRTLRLQVKNALRLGQYTLIEKLGEGGMGVVYRGSHALLRRPTAIKLLPPTKRNAHQLARFEREVRQTSRLAHPNTISIYDYGHTPEGIFYYAMEYLDGITLEELVQSEGPLPAGRVVHILEQVVGALTEAHGLGLIHRDIKPANIMLTRRGGIPDFVKVLDFGLVKESDGELLDTASVSRGVSMLGTPLYMAPEAILSKQQDARADLYAVGAVAYYLVCGSTVFSAPSVVEMCVHHLYTAPVPPSQRCGCRIPAELEALILQCLEKQSEARPQSALELLARLRKLKAQIEPFDDAQANLFWDERWPVLASQIASRRRASVQTDRGTPTVALDPDRREEASDAID